MIVTKREVAFVHYMFPLETLKLNPQDFWQGRKFKLKTFFFFEKLRPFR